MNGSQLILAVAEVCKITVNTYTETKHGAEGTDVIVHFPLFICRTFKHFTCCISNIIYLPEKPCNSW
jgi:hypothetical protein